MLFAVAAGPLPGQGQATVPTEYERLAELLSTNGTERRQAAAKIAASRDLSWLPGLVDALFFVRGELPRVDLYAALESLAGERPPRRYASWVEYIGRRPEIAPKPGYAAWKAFLLARIDPRYPAILYPTAPARIRLEEIVWGGVKLDGIPSLDDPLTVPAAEARYLRDDEEVFGVEIGGEARAYPLRHLSWHELANDTVGGEPIALSYCTLCGSAILYATRTPNGGAYRFGTSGLLYRSNKLMYDRSSYTLWSNLTGQPVVGRLAGSAIELPVLAMTRTSWAAWRQRFPATRVLALEQPAGKAAGFVYRPGAADRQRAGVRFPVWQQSELLPRDEEVYGIRLGGAARAWPLSRLYAERVVNDQLGEVPLVLVADPGAGSVRAYRRGPLTFRPATSPDQLVDAEGRPWRVAEHRLERLDGAHQAAEGAGERVPGHVAFWFGWYAFFPATEVYGEPAAPDAGALTARE